jgi:catechol 2,3-dioxygenase-like lactoylglutathione lyase family enzyme
MGLKIGGLCPLLQVFDMPTSIGFYRDALGFEVVSPVPEGDECDWALLRLNESELMLNTAYESPRTAPRPSFSIARMWMRLARIFATRAST